MNVWYMTYPNMGFSGLNLLRELYVRKMAWPYFYDSLAYAIIAQAE